MAEEYLTGTMKELSDKYCIKQPKQVDDITEEAPILARMPFAPSSHGLWHNYDKLTDVEGAGWVDMDSPLPTMRADGKLEKIDLGILGGKMVVPHDKAVQFGGKDAYFASKLAATQKKSGMRAESAIIYANLLPFAKSNKKLVDAGGTGEGYTMLAVTWEKESNCGLYSPKGFKMGGMMQAIHLSNGSLYEDKDGVMVYGMALKAYMGIMLVEPKKISGIVNITKDNVPTETMIDCMLADCRASNNTNTMILCHPKAQTFLNTHKGKSLQVVPDTKDFRRTFTHWNGVELVTSFNFTEGADQHIDVAA